MTKYDEILKMALSSINKAKNRLYPARLASRAILIELEGRGGFKSLMNDIRNDEDGQHILNEIENVIAEIIHKCIELDAITKNIDISGLPKD